jgi:hypothetical protein
VEPIGGNGEKGEKEEHCEGVAEIL